MESAVITLVWVVVVLVVAWAATFAAGKVPMDPGLRSVVNVVIWVIAVIVILTQLLGMTWS